MLVRWRSGAIAVAKRVCMRPVAICEHCPNFRTDSGFLAVLGAQRADAEHLAADAERRGWAEEATRHRRLIAITVDELADELASVHSTDKESR